jgi:tetratricopeptide (TPR) repeat protein
MEFSRIFPPLLVGTTIVFLQPEAAKAISAAEVAQIAQSVTVKLENPSNREQGSGIIIKKDGDTYYVLTAFHVVEKAGKYTLIGPDKQEYQINYQYEVLLAVYSKLPFSISDFGSIQTNIGLIKYETGDLEGAIARWQEAISINSKEVKPQLPQLALAVALYNKGDRSGSLRLGTMALRADKRYGNLQFLKTNLRGKRFLKDLAKFLKDPSIQEAIGK